MLSGLAIVFVYKQQNAKPLFVKVIWVILCIAELTSTTHWILHTKTVFEVDEDSNLEKIKNLWPYHCVFNVITSVLGSVTHWILAIEYLEVVLMLPLLLDPGQADLQKKEKRVKSILKVINAYFYV